MSATPGGIHQADGYVEFLRQIAGEEIAHRRKIAHRSRAAYLPFARYIGQGLYGSRFLHFEMTDLWVVGILNFFSRIGRVFYYPLHIRLPRTDPHLANQHVLHGSRIGFALHRQLKRATGFHRIEVCAPATIFAGFNFFGLTIKRNSQFLPRIGPPPNGNGLLALQHHMVAKQFGQSDFGQRLQGQQQEQGE